MKLRAKLIIAFLVVIILPISLISCAGGIIIKYQLNSIQQSYDVESDTMQLIKNPISILNRVTRGTYNEIKLMSLKNPKKLEDQEYIKELNQDLLEQYSFLIVRKGNDIIYVGNEDKGDKVVHNLPAFGDYNADIDGGIYTGGDNPFLIKQQDFFSGDNKECSIFVITDLNTLVPQIKALGIQFGISGILIILLTAAVLTLWLYKAMIKPINTLRRATNRMKEGDLDFTVVPESKDEIGLLCEDFEEMRLRLKELIETKMEYERNLKELISNISHDLKTPLTAIKGYSEGILDGVADTPEKLDKYLKTIYTKANDMTALVDELSLYSKYNCDSMPYHFISINLEQYFSDCINELMLDLEVQNIDVGYFNYVDPKVNIIADAEQLKRVINNIIGNSVKYQDKKKGIINIRIQELEDHEIQVEIEDNGKGIPAKDLPYIFERFYRADASRNSSRGGSGLGLAIAKKIIVDHNGKIWAKSKEKMGTTIYFTVKKEAAKV